MSDVLERVEKYLDAVDESHRSPFQKSVSYVDHDAGTFALEFFKVADLRALCAEVRALRHTVKYETDVAEQAISEVRALRADKARLDWLEARARKDESVEVGWSPAGFESDEYGGSRSSWPGGYYAVACDADGLYDHESLRAALDAAREAR